MIKIVINMNWSEVFVYKQNTSLVVVGVDLGGWRIKSVVASGVKEREDHKNWKQWMGRSHGMGTCIAVKEVDLCFFTLIQFCYY